MIMMMLALAAFLQPGQPAPAHAPSWRLFLGSADSTAIYVDMAGVRRVGDVANTPMYHINAVPTPEGLKSMTMRLEINCRNHTSLLVEAYAYDANGAYLNGASYGTAGRVPRTAAPGSDDARLEQWVCAVPPARP